MKTSLIDQVQTIEQEADKLVTNAKQKSEQDVTNLSKAMHDARNAIIAKADKTSEAIIAEHVARANTEAHKTIGESNDAVVIIHTTAEKNRSKAIAKAEQLLTAEYLS